MISLEHNITRRTLPQQVMTLSTEGEINEFMERMRDDYENNPHSTITDPEFADTFKAARSQLHLLRLRGAA